MSTALPTPCQIIDLDRLNINLNRANQLRLEADCKILLALKGFSSDMLFPLLRQYTDGVSASSLYEARLGRERFEKEVHTYSTAFSMPTFEDIVKYSDYIIFNSIQQYESLKTYCNTHKRVCGIRINPEYTANRTSPVNPCNNRSHLGICIAELENYNLPSAGIQGLHLHIMRADNSDILERTIDVIEKKFGHLLYNMKFLNLGGGQLVADDEYNMALAVDLIKYLTQKYGVDVIMEPCEGLMTESGYLATRVIDIKHNNIDIAIMDASPMCHLPMTQTVPYRCEIVQESSSGIGGFQYLLVGPTCYAGDIWGEYTFESKLSIGDILYFRDTAQYSIVRSNMFNGIPFPQLATYSKLDGLQIQKEYNYETFLRII